MDSNSQSSDEHKKAQKNISTKLLFAFGVGHVLNDVCSSMWFTYLLVYFHIVLQFDNWEAGLLLLVGQIVDAIANPFVGYNSDNGGWLCKYGKRKSWHLLGTICVITSFPFIFSPCINCTESHKWAQMIYFSVFIVIFQFGWAAVQIAHLALIPELSPNQEERTKLTAVRYTFTVISNVFVYAVAWVVIGINNTDGNQQLSPNDSYRFQTVVWICMSFGIICTIIFHVLVKEKIEYSSHDVQEDGPKRSFSDILCNLGHYQVALTYMSTLLFINMSQVFIPLYLHEALNMPATTLAVIPLIVYLGSFTMSLVVEKLNASLGRKITYIIGASIGLTGCVWIGYGSDTGGIEYEINAIAVLFGFGSSIILITSLGITVDLIGDKTGSGAFIYSIMCFSDKIANGSAVFLIQDLHKSFPIRMYYRNVLAYACGGSLVLGILAVLTLRASSDKSRERSEYIRLA